MIVPASQDVLPILSNEAPLRADDSQRPVTAEAKLVEARALSEESVPGLIDLHLQVLCASELPADPLLEAAMCFHDLLRACSGTESKNFQCFIERHAHT